MSVSVSVCLCLCVCVSVCVCLPVSRCCTSRPCCLCFWYNLTQEVSTCTHADTHKVYDSSTWLGYSLCNNRVQNNVCCGLMRQPTCTCTCTVYCCPSYQWLSSGYRVGGANCKVTEWDHWQTHISYMILIGVHSPCSSCTPAMIVKYYSVLCIYVQQVHVHACIL